MAVKINTATFNGINGISINVEVDISNGLPSFNIVGLADISIKESKERVRAAIKNSGFQFPLRRITINLAPADVRKVGSFFDLPIAIGILVATGQVCMEEINNYLFAGELSLLGELKKVSGILPIVLQGKSNNIKNFILPYENREESSIINEINVYAFKNLKEIIGFLKYKDLLPYCKKHNFEEEKYSMDYRDVIGQRAAKRALEVAAAGGHNILLYGPPGTGKSMLAHRIPTILPPLTYGEAIEVTKLYSVSREYKELNGLIYKRPFRSPHHTTTKIALVGGGSKMYPGEISLAHYGVLYLDEILEFKNSTLEVLRQPLEDRKIVITRASGKVEYPANIILVGSSNLCKCGNYLSNDKICTCTEYEIKKYLNRISGPLLDRIDIYSSVNSVPYKELRKENNAETSLDIRKRVMVARKIQIKRFKNEKIFSNAEMNENQIRRFCVLDHDANEIIKKIYKTYNLSLRAYSRILKVSRTLADLQNKRNITKENIIEAVQYRKYINNKVI